MTAAAVTGFDRIDTDGVKEKRSNGEISDEQYWLYHKWKQMIIDGNTPVEAGKALGMKPEQLGIPKKQNKAWLVNKGIESLNSVQLDYRNRVYWGYRRGSRQQVVKIVAVGGHDYSAHQTLYDDRYDKANYQNAEWLNLPELNNNPYEYMNSYQHLPSAAKGYNDETILFAMNSFLMVIFVLALLICITAICCGFGGVVGYFVAKMKTETKNKPSLEENYV
eukprot:191705_1